MTSTPCLPSDLLRFCCLLQLYVGRWCILCLSVFWLGTNLTLFSPHLIDFWLLPTGITCQLPSWPYGWFCLSYYHMLFNYMFVLVSGAVGGQVYVRFVALGLQALHWCTMPPTWLLLLTTWLTWLLVQYYGLCHCLGERWCCLIRKNSPHSASCLWFT